MRNLRASARLAAAGLLLALILPFASLAQDTDGDGIPDVGDNCPFAENAGQLNTGGVGTTDPDSYGDACQCGHVRGIGAVLIDDIAVLTRALAQLGPGLDPGTDALCNVVGPAFVLDLNGDGLPDDCNQNDLDAARRSLAGLDMGIDSDACAAAIPNQPPIPADNSYLWVGNTSLMIVNPIVGLLSNDFDPDGDALQVTDFDTVTALGGSVDVFPDGSFDYFPPAGVGGETDRFDYTVSDGMLTATASAMIELRSRVWYVRADPNSAQAGDGTLASPFTTLGAARAASSAGDGIFVYDGDYPEGITLKDHQLLIGEGSGLVIMPAAAPVVIVPAGVPPIIHNPNGAAITLARNNAVRGMEIGSSTLPTLTGILGNNVGNLRISSTSITASGGRALDLSSPSLASASITVSLDEVNSADSLSQGIRLENLGGTFTVEGGTITNSAEQGILVRSSELALTFNSISVLNSGDEGIHLFEVGGLVDPETTSLTGVTITNSGAQALSITTDLPSDTNHFLNVTNSSFAGNPDLTTTTDGIRINLEAGAVFGATLTNNTFDQLSRNGIDLIADGATVNSFNTVGVNIFTSITNDLISLRSGNFSQVSFDLTGNQLIGGANSSSSGIYLGCDTIGSLVGHVRGNILDLIGDSGVLLEAQGPATVSIRENDISNVQGEGIQVISSNAANAQVSILENSLNNTSIVAEILTSDSTICASIDANEVTGTSNLLGIFNTGAGSFGVENRPTLAARNAPMLLIVTGTIDNVIAGICATP